ncbi:MAG: hypothetical protein ABIM88_01460 [candidate division WOR-3 bacterium]
MVKGKERTDREMKYVLEQVAEEVPGFLYTAVVDMEMAGTVYELSSPEMKGLDGAKAASLCTDLVRSHMRNLDYLGGEEVIGRTTDIFIATDKYNVILRPLPEVMCCHVLLIKKDGPLGSARATVQKYSDSITRVLRG